MELLIAGPREGLALDYANTLSWRGSAAPAETLAGFAELLRWLTGAAGWPPEAIAMAIEWGCKDADKAAAVFAAAIAMREAIYRGFAAIAVGDPAPDPDLELLNRALAAAPERHRVARAGGGYLWQTSLAGLSAPTLLAPVLWSAADLLVGHARQRVRRCANGECLWLFVDASKSGTRRWCDMGSCGNRAKARRHYLKIKRG